MHNTFRPVIVTGLTGVERLEKKVPSKLNQIIAVEKGVKAQTENAVTAAYHTIQKAEPFSGISRDYQAKDDDGDELPSESVRVQRTVDNLLTELGKTWTRLLDLTATKDTANTRAKADVVVDGETLIADIPATYLVWLEKRLVDLRTLLSNVPTLDPAIVWTPDPVSGVWRSETAKTTRSQKVPRAHVLYEATPEHPAQVQPWTEDVIAGYWSTTKFSGALPQERVNELLDRVDKVQTAVKSAREEANGIEVTDVSVGKELFDYILAD